MLCNTNDAYLFTLRYCYVICVVSYCNMLFAINTIYMAFVYIFICINLPCIVIYLTYTFVILFAIVNI